jgi:hypothetical protein
LWTRPATGRGAAAACNRLTVFRQDGRRRDPRIGGVAAGGLVRRVGEVVDLDREASLLQGRHDRPQSLFYSSAGPDEPGEGESSSRE